jgi:hypothetical protein
VSEHASESQAPTPTPPARAGAVDAPPPEAAFVTEDHVSAPAERRRRGFVEWLEGSISKLSTRNNFWHRVCSFIWLPYAFRSGVRMRRIDGETFTVVLPFRRFNRNWYNAMAGASLLANSEIAGGMFVFSKVGRDYMVVCKELSYRFLRPCFGPAVYQAVPMTDIDEKMRAGGEFNVEMRLNVFQQLKAPGAGKQKRVGRVLVTFHVTPKVHHKDKKARRAAFEEGRAAAVGADGGRRSG